MLPSSESCTVALESKKKFPAVLLIGPPMRRKFSEALEMYDKALSRCQGCWGHCHQGLNLRGPRNSSRWPDLSQQQVLLQHRALYKQDWHQAKWLEPVLKCRVCTTVSCMLSKSKQQNRNNLNNSIPRCAVWMEMGEENYPKVGRAADGEKWA